MLRQAIGIDPDSKGFVCAQVKPSSEKVQSREFTATEADLVRFVNWVKRQAEPIVAIEGLNGLSRPIEKALREEGIVFYSLRPVDANAFRKAVLGQNKDNRLDAESVARCAMAMECQGKLERWRRLWFPDAELQLLTRSYERKSQAKTAEVNRLWKLLRQASTELYLALGGRHPDLELKANTLQEQGILTLLAEKPQIGEWKSLSEEELYELMGGGAVGRRLLIGELRKLTLKPVSSPLAVLIRTTARQIQQYKRDMAEIEKALEKLSKDNAAVQLLKEIRGIGTITACTIIAEIIDIRRFSCEDSLACYGGLGMRKYATGDSAKMIPNLHFNHRLKDALLTAAHNYVLFNPDSHLAGYHRNLLKKGMSGMEANKRVGRALVRVIFRTLCSLLVDSEEQGPAEADPEAGEGGMASGSLRSDRSHASNMPPSSRSETATKATVKRVGARGRAGGAQHAGGKRRVKSTKNA